MSIRTDALAWFTEKHGAATMPTHTSKFFKSAESVTHSAVWSFEIPMKEISSANAYINLICETYPNQKNFSLLKVPMIHFAKNLDKLYQRDQKLSLSLSAEQKNLYSDLRGLGNVGFDKFIVE